MIDQEKKWREGILFRGKEEFPQLCNLTIKLSNFSGLSLSDHAHCELCWDRISAAKTDIHQGYRSGNVWICSDCAKDFQMVFNWTILDDSCSP